MSPSNHTHINGHNHDHGHGDGGHEHNHRDPGAFYSKPWVQASLRDLDVWLKENATWIGIDSASPQRVLDYACGNGTASKALLPAAHESTVFRGLDVSAPQVKRYNEEAERLGYSRERIFAVAGTLDEEARGKQLFGGEEETKGFDLAVSSMALHHFSDPVAVMRRLGELVQNGPQGKKGAVVILDRCHKNPERDTDGADNADLDPAELWSVEGISEKIWPGFPPGKLKALMLAAGLQGVEVKMCDKKTQVPPTGGHGHDHRTRNGEGGKSSGQELVDTWFVMGKGYVS